MSHDADQTRVGRVSHLLALRPQITRAHEHILLNGEALQLALFHRQQKLQCPRAHLKVLARDADVSPVMADPGISRVIELVGKDFDAFGAAG